LNADAILSGALGNVRPELIEAPFIEQCMQHMPERVFAITVDEIEGEIVDKIEGET
jgi:hypothetical protein